MLFRGFWKWGWLNISEIALVNVNPTRSVRRKRLAKLRWCTLIPWPTNVLTPLLPNRPFGGTANALGSNQRSFVRTSPPRFPSATRSGSPPEVLVFDGSDPEKAGEKRSEEHTSELQSR